MKLAKFERLLKVCNRVVDGAPSDQIACWRLAGAVAVMSAGLENGTMLANEAYSAHNFGKTMSSEPATKASLQMEITEVTDMILSLAGDAKLVKFHTPRAIA